MLNESFKAMLGEVNRAIKPLGFKKRGNTFVYTAPSGNLGFVTFVTNSRFHKPETPNATAFTVEFGTASKSLLDRFRQHLCYSSPDKPSPSDIHYSSRIGYELGYNEDHWWAIEPANEAAVKAEILDGILDKGWRVIEREITDEAICARGLRIFDEGFRSNPAALLWLAYLLKKIGPEGKFDEVCRYTWEHFGDRNFEQGTIADFLQGLGFSPATA